MTSRLSIFSFRTICMLMFFMGLSASVFGEEDAATKRIELTLRTVGHELLNQIGDCTSRVLPITHDGSQYQIHFESDFGVDPSTVVAVFEQVMKDAGIEQNYLVEIQQCQTREVVHSFMAGPTLPSGMAPCQGRILPEDCYLINVNTEVAPPNPMDKNFESVKNLFAVGYVPGTKSDRSHAPVVVTVLVLFGFLFYRRFKQKASPSDENVVRIGESHFDKKNMVLSYKDQKTELSGKESDLLNLLHASANETLEREVILEKVWGDDGDYVGRTLDVFISKLRKKLEADATVRIINIRGVGYKLVLGSEN